MYLLTCDYNSIKVFIVGYIKGKKRHYVYTADKKRQIFFIHVSDHKEQ